VHAAVAVLVAILLTLTGTLTAAASAEDPPIDPGPVPTPVCPEADVRQPGATMTPPGAAPMGQGTYFSYPNRSAGERVAIRNRVVNSINATWGRWYTPKRQDLRPGCAQRISGWDVHRGTIRMATWTFNDWAVRDALVKAAQRGVSVQIIAAEGINKVGVDGSGPYKPWVSVRSYLRGYAGDAWIGGWGRNWAWECSGACRGRGGTPHSKFFLFDDVRSSGNAHVRNIVVQTSMNLTQFAYTGQWNQAVSMWNPAIYNRYLQVFQQMAVKEVHGYQSTADGGAQNTFYPGGSVSLARDPVLAALNQVRCTGATSGGINGRTRVRVIQYAIYDSRGTAIAKKLRGLWNAGCNVAIIYSVSSRPVLSILRARSGRGPVPMKQSVIKNGAGEIVKYNHSKWLAISGHYYGVSRGTWTVVSGSSNWSNFAYSCDEQMTQYYGSYWASPYFRTFETTWRQKTSRAPTAGGSTAGARMPSEPVLGQGIYRHMEND
jgi:hypothetical protein